jgi:signal transduction histidine kinase
MPTSHLTALLVEDNEDDAVLVLDALREGGFKNVIHQRVCSADGLKQALDAQSWDVVISDYSMPSFDAPSALRIVHERNLDVPFIIVSGSVGEELAVQAMKAGAHDYVMKDRLARLAPSVEREVRDARQRREYVMARQRAEDAVVEKQVAEAENQAKSRFFASLSHELRSPLNAILGYSDLLQRGIGGQLGSLQTEFLGHITAAGRHLAAVVNDILDSSRIEAGRLELTREPVPVVEATRFVISMFLPQARQCGVELDSDVSADLPPVDADPVRLRQVLSNLVSNAIKFTPSGGHVQVSARALEASVELLVSDEGVGIRAEDLPRLFRDFERVGHVENQIEGTGLGLSLTKRLVEMHGGSIHAESEWGKGSRFTVRFPTYCAVPLAASGRH